MLPLRFFTNLRLSGLFKSKSRAKLIFFFNPLGLDVFRGSPFNYFLHFSSSPLGMGSFEI